jgi:Pao retrotransposon peptidase/Family of unknown function (DUF5641)/Protein of unknown function (DUF1759)
MPYDGTQEVEVIDATNLKIAINARAIVMRRLTAIEKREFDMNNDAQCVQLLNSLQEIRHDFSIRHNDVCTLRPETFSQKNEEEQDVFEDRMEQLNSKLSNFQLRQRRISSSSVTQDTNVFQNPAISYSQPTDQKSHTIKLPKLIIAKFSGNPMDWARFREQFKAAVTDRTDINDVSKLSFLRSFLEGEAATLLDSSISAAEDFDLAWEILTLNFGLPRVIISSTIRSFIHSTIYAKRTDNILKLLTDVSNAYSRLQSCFTRCNITPEEQASVLCGDVIANSIDAESYDEFKRINRSYNGPYKAESLVTFLRERISDLRTGSMHNLSKITARTSHVVQDNSQSHVVAELRDINQRSNMNNAQPPQPISSSYRCGACEGNHKITFCTTFRNLAVQDRRELAVKKALCFNCLRPGHMVSSCYSPSRCQTCRRNHHTLVHMITEDSDIGQDIKINHSCASDIPTSSTPKNSDQRGIIPLVLAFIKPFCPKPLNIMIDSGSEMSLITTAIAELIPAHFHFPGSLRLIGVSDTVVSSSSSKVSITLIGKLNVSIIVNPYIVDHIGSSRDYTDVAHITNGREEELSDKKWFISRPYDILLGSDVLMNVLTHGIEFHNNIPIGYNTIFGIAVSSPLTFWPNKSGYCSNSVAVENPALPDDTPSHDPSIFWELEEIPNSLTPPLSGEEQFCEDHFKENMKRDKDGRIIVKLPIRSDSSPLGDSYSIALRRLSFVERALQDNPTRREMYNNFIREFIDLKHASVINPIDIPSDYPVYYLPHHAVFKDSSTTTKLRVVFDATAKPISGASLNSILALGRISQSSVFSLLVNFRLRPIGISADVEKMYRQVLIDESQRDLLRILWRWTPNGELVHIRMNAVTYGVGPAGFLATKALMSAAESNSLNSDTLEHDILQGFYVDNFLTSVNSSEEAITRSEHLIWALDEIKMPLRKWSSNSKDFLDQLPESLLELPRSSYDDENTTVQTLGIRWAVHSDNFNFDTTKILPVIRTKRELLASLNSIFDPLGFLIPAVFPFKLMYQQLWNENTGWDEHLPSKTIKTWNNLAEAFNKAMCDEPIFVSRWMGILDYESFEIHVFCDASTTAYAAAAYIKTNNSSSIKLLTAKGRLAPKKRLTVPRLELQAAVQAVKLARAICDVLKSGYSIKQVTFWSDSIVVLCWLTHPARDAEPFVANRLATILEYTSSSQWRHVPGLENPADCATRGLSLAELRANTLWWSGPCWLYNDSLSWPEPPLPVQQSLIPVSNNDSEYDGCCHIVLQGDPTLIKSTVNMDDYFINISRFTTMLRVIAISIRIFQRIKAKMPHVITSQELTHAKRLCILSDQRDLNIQDNRWKQFRLEADEDGVIHSKTRLLNADIPESAKFPIVLNRNGTFIRLYLTHLHNSNFHATPSILTALFRQNFTTIGLRSLVRKIVHQCVKCARYDKKPALPPMAMLPESRSTPSSPFEYTGLDYCGPFSGRVRRSPGKPIIIKLWVAVFICSCTRAIHIELVSDLTASTLIQAIERFVSRRGVPICFSSDNGTNMIASNRLLRESHTEWLSTIKTMDVLTHIASLGIEWNFIPPSAPSFGGNWESAVKLFKKHFVRVVGEQLLTYEEMNCLCIQIEGLLNSRPLGLSGQDNFDFILTPGHFLIGRPVQTVSFETSDSIRKSRWSLTHNMKLAFWKKWSNEYLSQFLVIPKTKIPTGVQLQQFEIGSIVTIQDDNLRPGEWPLGLIQKLHPSSDGIIRVATVKTSKGTLVRPILRLALMPVVPNLSKQLSADHCSVTSAPQND